MIGLVLAAGAGRRLSPDTDRLPKTLLSVGPDTTILDVILANLVSVGLSDVSVVVGHAAGAVEQRVSSLQERHGVRLNLIFNERLDWNNAYSLWCARQAYAAGALMVNGDTVHPVDVEKALLAQQGDGLSLAVDVFKPLNEEAMKVRLDRAGRLERITKRMPAEDGHGEYLGASLIGRGIAGQLTAALEHTWRTDPQEYYEGGFQVLADQGADVRAARMGAFDWVEVDDHADLARAQEIACHY